MKKLLHSLIGKDRGIEKFFFKNQSPKIFIELWNKFAFTGRTGNQLIRFVKQQRIIHFHNLYN